MCAGDLTLEQTDLAPDVDPSSGMKTVTGWGDSHQCRRWDEMWNFAVEHQYGNSTRLL